MAIVNATGWVTLPFVGAQLKSVTHIGNGKDAELRLMFASGSRVTLPVSRVRVETDRGVVVDVSGRGDAELLIDYSGADIYLHSGQFTIDDGGYDYMLAEFLGEMLAEFLDEAQSWVAAGGDKELRWAVRVELRLASRSSDLSGAV
jgi:hypothetical protein